MMTEDDSEMKWRDLALQFDGHRMQAISFLKMILSELPDSQYASARDFIKSGPLSGEEVLRNRIAALTQPASPALKLPDEMVMPIFQHHQWADRAMAQKEVDSWNACLAEVKRLNSPHTAPIEPICATGGAEWVKCSERMPEDESWVLVTNGKHVGVGAYLLDDHLEDDERWQDEHFEFINLQSQHPVSHWMPLPAAPEEE